MPGQENFRLTDDQIRFFDENGYLRIEQVVAPWEIEALDRETRRLLNWSMEVEPANTDYLFALDPETGRSVPRRVNNVVTKGDVFLALFGHPKLLGIGESLLGPDFVSTRADMVVKMPEYGAPVPWHRDPSHPRVLALIDYDVYLDPATPDNGCLYVIPGSQKWQGFDLQDMLDQHGFHLPGAVPVVTEPGDVVVHNTQVLHGSRVTRGKTLRRVIYFGLIPIEELQARSSKATEKYVRSWGTLMAHAIEYRAGLPETAGELPFRYRPSRPAFQIDPRGITHVEKNIGMFGDDFDPNYKYSPLSPPVPLRR